MIYFLFFLFYAFFTLIVYVVRFFFLLFQFHFVRLFFFLWYIYLFLNSILVITFYSVSPFLLLFSSLSYALLIFVVSILRFFYSFSYSFPPSTFLPSCSRVQCYSYFFPLTLGTFLLPLLHPHLSLYRRKNRWLLRRDSFHPLDITGSFYLFFLTHYVARTLLAFFLL